MSYYDTASLNDALTRDEQFRSFEHMWQRADGNAVLVKPDLWRLSDHKLAMREGWWLFLSDHLTKIIRVEPNHMPDNRVSPFGSDTQAREWVEERAHQGSEFHNRALVAEMKAITMGED